MSATSTRPAITTQLRDTRVVAILRARDPRYVLPVAHTLVEAGIRCLELTLTVPDALRALTDLARELPADVALGAGTVTTADQARDALTAGARFLVSPAVCQDVIAVGLEHEAACYPGAYTPTEVLTAWRAGATAVKLFPAATGGVGHLRRLREPLPDIPLIPTGGVDPALAAEFLAAGAMAVGVGGPLLGDALEGGDLAALRRRAADLIDLTRPR